MVIGKIGSPFFLFIRLIRLIFFKMADFKNGQARIELTKNDKLWARIQFLCYFSLRSVLSAVVSSQQSCTTHNLYRMRPMVINFRPDSTGI